MLHVIALPHTAVSPEYNTCAYTAKVYKFCKMFPDAILYANQGTTLPHIQVFSKADMDLYFEKYEWYKTGEVYKVPYDDKLNFWKDFNRRVITRLKRRIKPHDIICIIAGGIQREIADAFPAHITCEFGIGYEGVFAKYRVFESYAWMHHVYGLTQQKDGGFYDRVIPNFFDQADFPFGDKKEDYFLFASRPIDRKGISIVREIAKRGHKVKTIGKEKLEGENIEWMGYADTKMRGELMSKAKALLCPTIYIEPFGGVVVEAQMCGTPAITTNWGAFVETVDQGHTGYRCNTLQEFLDACSKVEKLWPLYIREHTYQTYSLAAVKPQYERYFEQLLTLFGQGWYSLTSK